MAREKSKSTRAASKSKSKTVAPATSLKKLSEVRNASLKQFGKSEKTIQAYAGHLNRGMKWLKELVAGAWEDGIVMYEGFHVDELETAFGKPPNKASAKALELFLTEKCHDKKRSKSTGEGIHGAFARYWDTM